MKFDDIQSRIRGAIHDIKNLLVILSGLMARISEAIESGDTDAARELVARAQTNIERVRGVADDHKEKPTKIDIVQLLIEVIDGFRARETGVRIDFEFQKKSLFVVAPMVQVYRAINNVLLNGLEAARWGSKKRVAIRVVSDGDYISISLFNDGPHIEKRNDSFEYLFERGFSTKENRRGLGLWIVKTALIEIGAKLLIRNLYQPDMGVEFVIKLRASKC